MNRTKIAAASLAALLLATGLALAQGEPAGSDEPESAPPPRSRSLTIFSPEIREKLNLTDDQVSQLRKLLAGLNRTLRIAQAKLVLLGYEVDDLIQQEGDLKVLQAKFEEESRIRAEARYADIVCSRNIMKVLSESQLAAWKAIQAEARAKSGSGDKGNK